VIFIAVKALLTPVLVVLCAIATRRWGETVGGLLLGLPITSGPLSVFLFVEHGRSFAENSARATLLGLLAAAAFCLSYTLIANGRSWWLSLGVAGAVCLGSVALLSQVHLGLALSMGIVAVILLLLASTSRDQRPARPLSERAPLARGQLAKRVVLASTIVVGITLSAGALGPVAAGLLAPLPVLVALMAVSEHRRGDRVAAVGILHGAVLGLWGAAAFFGSVGLLLPEFGPLLTYTVATGAALVAGVASQGVPRVRRLVLVALAAH